MEEEKVMFYNCSFCSKKFDRKDECLAHEKAHAKEKAFDNLTTFELKPEHIKLLTNMYVSWDDCEFGAPCIDCKRPYGNSDGVDDVAEVLGIKKTKDNVEGYDKEEAKEYDDKEDYIHDLEWNEETYEYLKDIHKETEIALQIVLKNKSFQLGIYKRPDSYGIDWKFAKLKTNDLLDGGKVTE